VCGKLKLKEYYIFFIVIYIVLIIITLFPVILTYFPDRNQNFVTMAILGDKGMAENYYPKNDPNIEIHEEVNWQLYISNKKKDTIFISIKIKISNSTVELPKSTSCIPNPATSIYEIQRIIEGNETWIKPITWKLEKFSITDNIIKLEGIKINDKVIDLNTVSKKGYNFRLIFELWLYDLKNNNFHFVSKDGDMEQCVWNQIWFNFSLN
jgi:uncharacterized membrane protein